MARIYGLGTLSPRKSPEEPMCLDIIPGRGFSRSKPSAPVSYTHLDVYKRQAQAVFDEMQLTRSWALAIVGDEWPLQHRRVLGCAIRVRNPYVDALSLAQVRALRVIRNRQEELSDEVKTEYLGLILATVTGVSAGLQNTG